MQNSVNFCVLSRALTAVKMAFCWTSPCQNSIYAGDSFLLFVSSNER